MPSDNFLWFTDAATGGLLSSKATKPEGETQDDTFKAQKALEIIDFSFGLEQADTTTSMTGGAGAGKVKFNEFSIKKSVDTASVPLFNACAAGAHFPSVMLAIRKAGGSQLIYLQYIFRMVFVIGISWSGGSGEEAPTEEVKFRFGALGIQYQQQSSTGAAQGAPIPASWSVVTNKNDLTVPNLPAPPSFLKP